MKQLLFLVWLAILPYSLYSQDFQATLTNKGMAYQQIKQLRSGALVVRLRFSERQVEQYMRAGNTKTAQKIQRDRLARNKEIIEAFEEGFRFCPVYFVSNSNYKSALKRNEAVFLNTQLLIDSNIFIPDTATIFFAEYGTLMANVRRNENTYSGTRYTEESSTPVANDVFIISDSTLRQLQEPFPFYSRTRTFLEKKPLVKAVTRLNNGLFNFLVKVLQREQRGLSENDADEEESSESDSAEPSVKRKNKK